MFYQVNLDPQIRKPELQTLHPHPATPACGQDLAEFGEIARLVSIDDAYVSWGGSWRLL